MAIDLRPVGALNDAGRDRVQIDVSARGQERFFVEDCDAFEACLEEGAARLILSVGEPG
jgi:hypothetical protein